MIIYLINKHIPYEVKDKVLNWLYNQSFNTIMRFNDFWYTLIMPIKKKLNFEQAMAITIKHITIRHWFAEKYKELSIILNKWFFD